MQDTSAGANYSACSGQDSYAGGGTASPNLLEPDIRFGALIAGVSPTLVTTPTPARGAIVAPPTKVAPDETSGPECCCARPFAPPHKVLAVVRRQVIARPTQRRFRTHDGNLRRQPLTVVDPHHLAALSKVDQRRTAHLANACLGHPRT